MRQVSHRLHPAVIQVGLVPAVRALVAREVGPPRVELLAAARLIELDDPGDNNLPESLRLAAYRLVEEALANVHRHAQASTPLPFASGALGGWRVESAPGRGTALIARLPLGAPSE